MPVCAACLALLASVVFAACLNPMPEEFPSDRDTAPTNGGQAVGSAGTGNTATESGGGAAGGAPGDSQEPVTEPSSSAPSPAETPPTDTELPDAGADAATPSNTVTDSAP